MADLVPGHDRVLRKRNKPLDSQMMVLKKTKNIRPYYVFNEHNYFDNLEKKRCRWPIPEMSLPDWLTDNGSSSDEEDNNNEVESLAYLLKMELNEELKNEVKLILIKF